MKTGEIVGLDRLRYQDQPGLALHFQANGQVVDLLELESRATDDGVETPAIVAELEGFQEFLAVVVGEQLGDVYHPNNIGVRRQVAKTAKTVQCDIVARVLKGAGRQLLRIALVAYEQGQQHKHPDDQRQSDGMGDGPRRVEISGMAGAGPACRWLRRNLGNSLGGMVRKELAAAGAGDALAGGRSFSTWHMSITIRTGKYVHDAPFGSRLNANHSNMNGRACPDGDSVLTLSRFAS